MDPWLSGPPGVICFLPTMALNYTESLDRLRTELSAEFAAQMLALEQENRSLVDIVTCRPTSRLKPVLPDPEKFTGKSYKYDTWLAAIKAKLRIDSVTIGDDLAQFYYVYLNLDTSVQALVLPQLSAAEDNQVWDYKSLLNQLALVYSNPNKIREAEDHLYQLHQGTDNISTFLAKFEQLLYEAKGQNWPDTNKISVLRNGLNQTLWSQLGQ